MNKKNNPPVETLSYEEALVELEEIVSALENEEHTLEISINLFERGQNLLKHCAGLLDHAVLRVKQISNGEIIDMEP